MVLDKVTTVESSVQIHRSLDTVSFFDGTRKYPTSKLGLFDEVLLGMELEIGLRLKRMLVIEDSRVCKSRSQPTSRSNGGETLSTFAHSSSSVPMTCFEAARPQRWNGTEASTKVRLLVMFVQKRGWSESEARVDNVHMKHNANICTFKKRIHSETQMSYIFRDFLKMVTIFIIGMAVN